MAVTSSWTTLVNRHADGGNGKASGRLGGGIVNERYSDFSLVDEKGSATMNAAATMPLSPQTKDRALLLLTAIGVAAFVMLAIFVLVAQRKLDHLSWKWARFTVVTIAFVVYCLKTHWRVRKSPQFWALLLGILVLHFLGIGYFFYSGEGLPLALFGPTLALEWALLALIVYHILGVLPKTR
jgi:hypothetical protein